MSAPPIGTMSSTPSAKLTSTTSQNTTRLSPRTKTTSSTTSSTPSAMLMRCRLGSMIGLPDIRPSSFRKAMMEPVKVMAPIATPSAISNSDPSGMWPGWPMPKACGA